MVKCLYPDCDGELEPGAPFCDECGRSQNAAQVAAARAGAAARTLAPPLPTTPVTVPNLRAAVVPRVPAAVGPPRSVTVPLAIGFGLIFTLVFVGCVAALAIQIALSPLVPVPNRPVLAASPTLVRATPIVVYTPTAARGKRTVTVVPVPGAVSSPTVPR
jgi:hypothetical protein